MFALSASHLRIRLPQTVFVKSIKALVSTNVWTGEEFLSENDAEIDFLIKQEKSRQRNSLELVASENYCSRAVLEATGSCLTNKYAQGFPGHRYYRCTEFVDKIELLCQKRALEAFDLDPAIWGVTVQSYSGSLANLAIFAGLLKSQDRIMGLDVLEGGHVTHGCIEDKQRNSTTSLFFETMSYRLNPDTGLVDYDMLAKTVALFQPQIIIAGASSYSRLLDYKNFYEICQRNGAILMADISHVSGMMAAKLIPSAFEYSQVIMTTTHKTLRGPRAALIFYKKTGGDDFGKKINSVMLMGLQGGPHIHAIAATAVALKLAKEPAFVQYQEQVLRNAQTMANVLKSLGYKIVTGGTDNHQVIVDLRSKGIDGAKVETVCSLCGISVNFNNCPGDRDVLNPAGLRLGSLALTSRQFKEKDFEVVMEFLNEVVHIALEVQDKSGPICEQFEATLKNEEEIRNRITNLSSRVRKFASGFPMPGFPHY